MKISFNWLKEYLPVNLTAEKVAELLTNTGLEVEGMEKWNITERLSSLVIGEVLEVNEHPDADRLKVAKVNINQPDPLQIICGAPNIAKGQKVIIALPGATVYSPSGEKMKIRKAKIRGVSSEGMICAEDEIGLGDDHSGIMILDPDAETGISAQEYFEVEDDTVFDIGLTPNRSDAMSHIGVARDLSAALYNDKESKPLKIPSVEDYKKDNDQLVINVRVNDPEKCLRYSGVTVSNIKVKPSPRWLQNRLRAIGQRPVNNIVDITNYILHETGQPLHAFDAEKIKGNKVIVKTLPDKTPFETLDKEEQKLHHEDLMICNEEEGLCIAGVFGGAGSGVSTDTTSIFLESACFDPVSIRRTAGRHDLRTDAAIHFEKGTDPNNTIYPLKRAAMLIREIAGGEISSDITDIYPEQIEPFRVSLYYPNLQKLSGAAIPENEVKTILNLLGICITGEKDKGLDLEVPTFKQDVTREADIIEEVLRIYGYNKVPFPPGFKTSLSSRPKPDTDQYRNQISDLLCSNEFHEIMSSSLTRSAYFNKTLPLKEENLVRLLSSSNAALDILRPTLLFSGLEAIIYNLNRQVNNIKCFEFGKAYWRKGEAFIEKEHLSIFLTGHQTGEHWRNKQQEDDIYYTRSFIDMILEKMNINDLDLELSDSIVFENGLKYSSEGKDIAAFGQIAKSIIKVMDIDQPVFFIDLNWNELVHRAHNFRKFFKEIPKFPSVRRDLALVLDKEVEFEQIKEIAANTEKKVLHDINLFDIYEHEKLGKDKKSYAISFIFRDNEKTLTDKDVDHIMKRLAKNYETEIGASIRE